MHFDDPSLEILLMLLLIHASYGIPILYFLIKEERKNMRVKRKEKMMSKGIGVTLGRFLSDFRFVLLTLLVHVILAMLTWLLLAINIPPEKASAGFLAYEIATGGDPFNFKECFQAHYFLWTWVLVFHVASWLIVPVLAATAVDAAHRIWEERQLSLDKYLRTQVKELLDLTKLTPEEKSNKVEELLDGARVAEIRDKSSQK
ncbi:MAG TPA: hypothetical protein VJZ26_08635 [Blastocatellia bacterium]|nr:hypothetical protein [Blastocatellia bacterium]